MNVRAVWETCPEQSISQPDYWLVLQQPKVQPWAPSCSVPHLARCAGKWFLKVLCSGKQALLVQAADGVQVSGPIPKDSHAGSGC